MKKDIFKNKSILLILIICLFAASIRIPYLDKFPVGLYSDEVSQGYNAYSILKTGKDEYGTAFPISFRSFGDWKPPLPTYVMVPTIALFGLNPWGIRMPSALFGVGSIFLSYLLVITLIEELTKNKFLLENRKKIGLVTAVLMSISPWHIMQSRSAMLIIVELFFLQLCVLAFYLGKKNAKWWLLSAFSAACAIYSYYGMRLIIPILIFYFLITSHRKLLSQWKVTSLSIMLGGVLLIPLISAFLQNPDVVMGRAKTVSIFHDQGTALTVWELITQDGPGIPSWYAQILHNKPYHYVIDIIRRFFEHFDGNFLFLVGDKHPPFQIAGMGVLYLLDIVGIVLGIIFLIKKRDDLFHFLIFWIFISVLPSSLTFVTPAANRTFTAVFGFMTIIAIGIVWGYSLLKTYKTKLVAVGILISLYTFHFLFFLHTYFVIMPHIHADWWHGGYRDLFGYLKTEEKNYKQIAISAKASVPYIFLLYFEQIHPSEIESKIRRNLVADEFGFEHVDSFGIYRFPRHFSWEKDGERLPNHSLLIVTPTEQVGTEAKEKKIITFPNGKLAYRVYEIEKIQE